jgi:hypothetical protein
MKITKPKLTPLAREILADRRALNEQRRAAAMPDREQRLQLHDIRRSYLRSLRECAAENRFVVFADRRREGCLDPHIIRACELLADPPPVGTISIAWLSNAAANAAHMRGQIFVDERSDAYQSATRGDHVDLAALLAHERVHQRGERDEAVARREQARVARTLREQHARVVDRADRNREPLGDQRAQRKRIN